jgi:uncharacterized protein YydD (DUF2326 family)
MGKTTLIEIIKIGLGGGIQGNLWAEMPYSSGIINVYRLFLIL